MHRTLAAFVCLAVSLSSTAVAAASSPAITFERSAVVISGVKEKGSVAWLEAARVFVDMSLRLVRRSDIAVDDDGDGVVRIELEEDVPEQSVWVAVDLTSGAFVTAAAQGSELKPLAIPPSALRPGALGASDVFETAGVQLDLLLARPGAGAWSRALGDGGDADLDGQGDGRLELALEDLRPLGDSPALSPPGIKPGDVLIVVDPLSLQLYAAQPAVPK